MYTAVTKTFNRALISSVYFKYQKHQVDYANFRPLSLGMRVSSVVTENVPLFHQRTSPQCRMQGLVILFIFDIKTLISFLLLNLTVPSFSFI